jgi:hypothetical protein
MVGRQQGTSLIDAIEDLTAPLTRREHYLDRQNFKLGITTRSRVARAGNGSSQRDLSYQLEYRTFAPYPQKSRPVFEFPSPDSPSGQPRRPRASVVRRHPQSTRFREVVQCCNQADRSVRQSGSNPRFLEPHIEQRSRRVQGASRQLGQGSMQHMSAPSVSAFK